LKQAWCGRIDAIADPAHLRNSILQPSTN